MTQSRLDIFLVAPPGMEPALRAEALDCGFSAPKLLAGGVGFKGRWQEVWRANLVLRGATRVLVRIAQFPVTHLSQLDKKAHQVNWADHLAPGSTVKVEATCRKSRIYHDRAAAQRVETALKNVIGATIADGIADGTEPALTVKLRIEKDLCTISLDTSGDSLHKRGHKTATGKAPMRETLAALFLREMGFDGRQPVLDPMCGSGTFVIEAAEWAAGLMPGRDRHFAFENFASFDADLFAEIKARGADKARALADRPAHFFGTDRNAGAIANSRANAESAGVAAQTHFTQSSISDLSRPLTSSDGPPGIVIVNPPYGERIGDKRQLFALYGRFGQVMREQFSGWRVGVITSDGGLAQATGLPFLPPGPPIDHGGLRIKLYQTAPLP